MNKPKIYFAGRIRKSDGWRPGSDANGRSILHDGGTFLEEGFPLLDLGHFVNTGPYFISCDHGCAHGTNLHGVGADFSEHSGGCVEAWGIESTHDKVREICLKAIDNSDAVFAWLEPEAYGTVAEVAYAFAKGKKVFVAGPDAHSYSDLWFVAGMSSIILLEKPHGAAIEAMLKHLSVLPNRGEQVYFVQSGTGGPIKIGYTSMSVEKRMASLQTAHPEPLRLLIAIDGNRDLEKELHTRFNRHRKSGEWFSPHSDIIQFILDARS